MSQRITGSPQMSEWVWLSATRGPATFQPIKKSPDIPISQIQNAFQPHFLARSVYDVNPLLFASFQTIAMISGFYFNVDVHEVSRECSALRSSESSLQLYILMIPKFLFDTLHQTCERNVQRSSFRPLVHAHDVIAVVIQTRTLKGFYRTR